MLISINDNRITKNEFTIDPVGTIFYFEGRVLRCINNDYVDHILKLINCGLLKELYEKDLFPMTNIVEDIHIEGCGLIIEHQKIPFATRPCEWSFNMLKDASIAMINVLKVSNRYGYTLKDGHLSNVSFFGHKPIFLDLGSFILSQRENIWNAYEEFVENVIIPINLWVDGNFYIANRILSDYVKNRFAPNKKLIDQSCIRQSIENRKYSLLKIKNIFNRKSKKNFFEKKLNYAEIDNLIDKISSLEKPRTNTDWNKYHDRFFDGSSIVPYERFDKHSEFIKNYGADTLIDFAGNRGLFSFFASKKGIKNILCTDRDENVIDILYQQLKNNNMDNNNITPMLHNVMYPISSRFSNYNERICADAVVAFALTHHLLLAQNIQIDYILRTIGDHSRKLVGVEFMPMGLWDGLSGNPPPPVPEWYTREWFRANFTHHFFLLHEEHVEDNRIIFWGEKGGGRVNTSAIISKSWKDIEYFDEEWKCRISTMARFIKKEKSIIDFGCGKQWLKEFLPITCTHYFPVDYKQRSDDTIVCDFNKKEFPDFKADLGFVSGCLEYVEDYAWFIRKISTCCCSVIISYCSTGKFPEIRVRRELAWVNDLSKNELIDQFKKNDMILSVEHDCDTYHIFKFSK
jgi:hypothetical protein